MSQRPAGSAAGMALRADVTGDGLLDGPLGKLDGTLSESQMSTAATSALNAHFGAEPSPTSRASGHSRLTLDTSSDTAGNEQTLELDSPGCSTSSFCGFPGFLGAPSRRPSRREGIRSMPASLHAEAREATIRSKSSSQSTRLQKQRAGEGRQSGEAEPDDTVSSPSSALSESGCATPPPTRFATAASQLGSPARPAELAGSERQSPGQPPIANLGPREPLGSLASEFKHNASFGAKVLRLEAMGYDGWRRVRGDGNCYYRAVGMGLLEQTVLGRGPRSDEWTDALLRQLGAVKLEDAASRAAHERLLEQLASLREHPGDRGEREQRLLGMLNGPDRALDLALIRAVRLLTAEFMSRNRESDFAGGLPLQDLCPLLELGSLDDFLNEVVTAEGVEAQDLVLQTMPLALGIWVRVAFLDRVDAPGGAPSVPIQDFGPGLVNGGVPSERADELPLVHLQLRPGHYDLLYFGGH